MQTRSETRDKFVNTTPACGFQRNLLVWITPEMIDILMDMIPPCFDWDAGGGDGYLHVTDLWDGKKQHTITPGDLASALHHVAIMPTWSHLQCRPYAVNALLRDDPGMIDGELSYVVWQIAVTGEIKYDV